MIKRRISFPQKEQRPDEESSILVFCTMLSGYLEVLKQCTSAKTGSGGRIKRTLLGLVSIELVFFITAHMVLCFRFLTKTVLITLMF